MKNDDKTNKITRIPIIFSKTVCFPETSIDLDIEDECSKLALKAAEELDNIVVISLDDYGFSYYEFSEGFSKLSDDEFIAERIALIKKGYTCEDADEIIFNRDMIKNVEEDLKIYEKRRNEPGEDKKHFDEIIAGARKQISEYEAKIQKIEDSYEKNNPENKILIGIRAKVVQHIKSSNGAEKVFLQCLNRVKYIPCFDEECGGSFFLADTEDFNMENNNIELSKRLITDIKSMFNDLAKIESVSNDIVSDIKKKKNPMEIISLIAYSGVLSYEQQRDILGEDSLDKALEVLTKILITNLHVANIRLSIAKKAKLSIEADRRENIIREQINALNSQLSNNDFSSDDNQTEIDDFHVEADVIPVDEIYRKQLHREISNYSQYPPMSQEASVIKSYLQFVFSLPWTENTKLNDDIAKAESILDSKHYGLEKVKERIAETLAVQSMTKKTSSEIICLVGPPGTGKTSIAKSIAEAAGRNYVRISLGGVRDEAEIRGHRRTYLGSMPGRIIKALNEAQVNNPLILFDEIDKMSSDMRGDPASALLEVLDSEQNKSFKDHYIEIPFDLSNIMFVATANDMSGIPAPLADRMEIIEISSYTREEKFHIAKDYLIPKQMKKHGLTKSKLKISDEAVYTIIDSYTKEAGVRELERKIASLCRKVDKVIISKEAKSLTISQKRLESLLGVKKYNEEPYIEEDSIGTVNGLAWTSVGGVLLPVEAVVMKGKGRVQLTGSLGDVMQESAKIAISYARMQSEKYGYDEDFIDNNDIHIHAPEGAVPKDGPSAGVTMTTALISALSGRKVNKNVAMTGEITLHGDVLPIGGLKEKTMAAYKAGMKTVIVPLKNKPDMEEVDSAVKNNLEFVFVKTLDEVLSTALR